MKEQLFHIQRIFMHTKRKKVILKKLGKLIAGIGLHVHIKEQI